MLSRDQRRVKTKQCPQCESGTTRHEALGAGGIGVAGAGRRGLGGHDRLAWAGDRSSEPVPWQQRAGRPRRRPAAPLFGRQLPRLQPPRSPRRAHVHALERARGRARGLCRRRAPASGAALSLRRGELALGRAPVAPPHAPERHLGRLPRARAQWRRPRRSAADLHAVAVRLRRRLRSARQVGYAHD